MFEIIGFHDVGLINLNNYTSLQQADEIFKDFVDVIIPRTPELAERFGRVQYYGALDAFTDEYLIMSLNNFDIPVAVPTAELLEGAAELLTTSQRRSNLVDQIYDGWSAFRALIPKDRLLVITLLEEIDVSMYDLPAPFQNNLGFIHYVTNTLNRLTLMGYYSEWSGYGYTRLNAPDQRTLEHYPISWEQVGYPGPSLGYRALRVNNSL